MHIISLLIKILLKINDKKKNKKHRFFVIINGKSSILNKLTAYYCHDNNLCIKILFFLNINLSI